MSMEYILAQKAWVKENSLKINSKVRVINRVRRVHEYGWPFFWFSTQDKLVGKTLFVADIINESIMLRDKDGNEWAFPYFVLKTI